MTNDKPRERPIIFTAESVLGILAGTKTMTRRVIKPQPVTEQRGPKFCRVWRPKRGTEWFDWGRGFDPMIYVDGPFQLGMTLWVRESFTGDWRGNGIPARGCINYRADGEIPEQYREGSYWRSPMYMPRWASRLSLQIESVRVERLQDISDADAIAEGLCTWLDNEGVHTHYGINRADVWEQDPRLTYKRLWDSINGKRSGCAWADNPLVWRLSFRRVTP